MTRMARAVGALLLIAGCASGPRAVALGTELCAHCHMTVADPRFVAQLVTTTGKVLVYDDAGCLATALQDAVVPADRVGSLWVTNFLDATALLDATGAWYVQAATLNTPMASGLAAVASAERADSLAAVLGGAVLRWDAVRGQPHGH